MAITQLNPESQIKEFKELREKVEELEQRIKQLEEKISKPDKK